jgi:hypothetical protein
MSAPVSVGSGVLAAASAGVEKNADLCRSPAARRTSDASGTTIRGSSAFGVCAAAGATRAIELAATRSTRILNAVTLMLSYATAHLQARPACPRSKPSDSRLQTRRPTRGLRYDEGRRCPNARRVPESVKSRRAAPKAPVPPQRPEGGSRQGCRSLTLAEGRRQAQLGLTPGAAVGSQGAPRLAGAPEIVTKRRRQTRASRIWSDARDGRQG